MQQQLIELSRIKPNTGQIKGLPANPRIFKDDKYKKLKKSIEEDPDMLELRELIVIPFKKDFIVIAGNFRLAILTDLKHKEAYCKVLPANTPVPKLKAISIKDNVSFGDWNWDMLQEDWDMEQLGEWGLDMPDFGMDADGKDDFDVPSGEKPPFKTLTFVLSDAQFEVVQDTINQAKGCKIDEVDNKNSNGNALHRICCEWLVQKR